MKSIARSLNMTDEEFKQHLENVIDDCVKEEINGLLASDKDIKSYMVNNWIKAPGNLSRIIKVVNNHFPELKDMLNKLMILR